MELVNVWMGKRLSLPEKYKLNTTLFRRMHSSGNYQMIGHKSSWGLLRYFGESMYSRLHIILNDPNIDASNKSNVLRYAFLYIHGGIYTDTDVRVIRPLAEFWERVHRVGEPPVVAAWEDEDNLGTAVLIARPNCDLFLRLLEDILDDYESCEGDTGTKKVMRWGPMMFNLLADPGEILALPSRTFYPLRYDERDNPNVTIDINQTYAIHTWDHSWANPNNEP